MPIGSLSNGASEPEQENTCSPLCSYPKSRGLSAWLEGGFQQGVLPPLGQMAT
jgi:hypothetical protein